MGLQFYAGEIPLRIPFKVIRLAPVIGHLSVGDRDHRVVGAEVGGA